MKPNDLTPEFVLVPELGVTEPWQALYLLPHQYTDLSRLVTDFAELEGRGGTALVRGRVVSVQGLTRDRKPTGSPFPQIISMVLSDGTYELPCESFSISDWKRVEPGDVLTIHCKVRYFPDSGLSLSDPVRETCRAEPRADYKGVSGKVAGERVMMAAQSAAMDTQAVRGAAQWLAQEHPQLDAMVQRHWGDTKDLFLAIHAPADMSQARAALDIARRLCVYEVRLASRMNRQETAVIDAQPGLRRAVWDAAQSQPEQLSPGQLAALKLAVPALSGTKPEWVLINGDVGSGKTLPFLCIVAGFAKLGMRSAIMAPRGAVARQIYGNVTRRFPGLSCRYLGEGIVEGPEDALVWIGTTALLHAKDRPEMALVVVDEQHKFSKSQRLQMLSAHTHLLEATATPIPQTMASALYGDCVLANIPTPPVSRQIRSHLLDASKRSIVVDLMRAALAAGKKVLLVYASVNQAKPKPEAASDVSATENVAPKKGGKGKKDKGKPKVKAEDARAVTVAYAEVQQHFPGKVALVHGQMRAEEAAAQLQSFHEGAMPILMSTTAVEVGVDTPGVRLVVVNDPDRLSMFQLHQIRGRGARDGGHCDFVMYTKKALNKKQLQRLTIVKNINNGFKLAEEDLKLRGFGEVAGELQTGVTETTFKLTQLTPQDFVRQR
ncbi:helicase-related protein [Noviherbaspirillum pedocola]|uniref:DEAD/DEAH box helicase n=1 Tax=Noviherbaspirillum pedocola TaxID=2801341 RepID=A0A934W8N4_9BURK|nr:helicase-related protein [Noviherbaspirillum pedocola]MBK4736029.1 DEAD/DEAH box helicase [Noviherbaspirillum pedocola]